MRRNPSTKPSAVGATYHDICQDPAACPCCTTWPLPGESRAAWLARLGRAYRADWGRHNTENSRQAAKEGT